MVVAGDPDKSLLILAVRKTHERIKMPPQGKLSDQEINDLTAWVRAGAVWPETPALSSHEEYWAFQKVEQARRSAAIAGRTGLIGYRSLHPGEVGGERA